MAQLITDDFPLAASVWNGDKFLMEAATSSGSKRMKVTAEVVGAYLSGSGSGTVIAPDSIPIEDIDAITDAKTEQTIKAKQPVAVQKMSPQSNIKEPSTPSVAITQNDTTKQNDDAASQSQNTAIKKEPTKSANVSNSPPRTAVMTDLTLRSASIKDLAVHSAKVTAVTYSAKVNEITRKATITDGTPRARVILVG